MFNISFAEMLIIGVVLIVFIGPKRLPAMMRFLGHLLGRVNRQVSSLKREIKREIELEDLRETVRETKQIAKEATDTVRDAANTIGPQSSKPRDG